jgi:hypothetical protein
MFLSYGQLWAIKYVISKTRVKMLVTIKKLQDPTNYASSYKLNVAYIINI